MAGKARIPVDSWFDEDPDLELVSSERVKQVLAGTLGYDELESSEEQAAVRAMWDRGIKESVKNLRLDLEFAAEGREYVELDEDGRVVIRRPHETKGSEASSPRPD